MLADRYDLALSTASEAARDALVLATAANPNGLISASGRIGQKRQIAALMDSLRPALRRRLLVPCPSCHGAVREWAARGRAPENRALRGREPEQRAWCARV